MKVKLAALFGAVVVGASVAIGAGAAFADAPTPVGAHRHYFIAGDGSKVYVGPNFCELSATQQGFAGFHHKVHATDPGLVNINFEVCP